MHESKILLNIKFHIKGRIADVSAITQPSRIRAKTGKWCTWALYKIAQEESDGIYQIGERKEAKNRNGG